MSKRSFITTISFLGVLAAACGGAPSLSDGAAPDATLDGVDELGSVTNCNTDGCWTATSIEPLYDSGMDLQSRAVFQGPAGKLRKMGVCLLKLTTTTCSGADAIDPVQGYKGPCIAAVGTVPAGGYRYCTGIDGGTTKYCAVRPGPQTTYCAGSPALACKTAAGATCAPCNPGAGCFPQPVPPGEYTSPRVTVPAGSYVSYACFEACNGSEPATSSVQRIVTSGGTPNDPCSTRIFGCNEN